MFGWPTAALIFATTCSIGFEEKTVNLSISISFIMQLPSGFVSCRTLEPHQLLKMFCSYVLFPFQTSLFGWCVLPASSQTFVERDDDQLFIALRSGEVQLRGKKLLLRLQHFVVVGFASEVTLSGKLHRFF